MVGKTSKWWPMLSMKADKEIQWCSDTSNNVRARRKGDPSWRYLDGDGVKAAYAHSVGSQLIYERDEAVARQEQAMVPYDADLLGLD
jgi:hypothetical protein